MKNRILMCFFASGLGFIVPLSAHAESGTADILLSGISTLTSIPMGDTMVTTSSTNGTVTFVRSSGGPFVEGASGIVQCARFSRKTPSSFESEADCVATFSPDETVQLLSKRRTGDVVAGTSGEGTLQLSGGTGRFAGMSGQCKYKVENLPGNWNVTTSKCQWTK
jgi:hypothetical protein